MNAIRPARLRGVLAPVVTPFHRNLDVDVDAFAGHCRWLVENGAGLAIFGTNSEANSLSAGERIDATDALIAAGIPAAMMMPGTGTSSITDTVMLTRHAVQSGAAGALMLPPFFYKNLSDEGLLAYYSEVIERVGDARLQLYLYHIPALSGAPISLNLIEQLLKRYPDTLAGVKDSSGDWANTKAMIDRFATEGLDIFPASEALLSNALPIGGAGCISATVNVNPAGIVRVHERWNQPEGGALQEQATAVRKIFQSLPMIAAMKHVIADWKGSKDWRIVRPPLTPFGEQAGQKLMADLQAIGFGMADGRARAS